MPTVTALSFFVPRTPVVRSRDKRWTPYRNQQWSAWLSGLRLFGKAAGPVKEPIDYPVRIKATVRWPRCGVEVSERHPGDWRLGVEQGLVRSQLLDPDAIKTVEIAWELTDVDKCGTMIEIEPMEEHNV